MRWACAVAGVAMVVSGCSCPPPPVVDDCTDTTISFETPTADQTVDSPFDVSVIVKAANGNAFAIDSATLSVGGNSFTATVSSNRATFTGVTASAGAQTLTATIAQGSCSKSSSPQNIVVRDACSMAAVTAVTFPQDQAAPLGVLNRTELPPGTNLQVKVDAACAAGVQVRIKRGNTEVSPLTAFTNGSATITIPTLPDADEARYDLFAELVRGTTVLNSPSGNPTANTMIQVSRALPVVALTVNAVYGPADDVDAMAPGLQVRVTGTASPNGVTCTLSVSGQTPQGVMPAMGDVSADFTLTSGDYTATLSCTDSAFNTASSTQPFKVVLVPPLVEILFPDANPDGGRSLVTVSPQPVDIHTDAPMGSDVTGYRVQGVNRVSVGSAVVDANGNATLDVPFSADGLYEIEVNVEYPPTNIGSATRSIEVALTGCGLGFSVPAVCPAYVRLTNFTFQTQSKAVCVGQTSRLIRSPVFSDGGVGTSVLVGTASLTASGAAGFATTNADGTYRFRAEVDNVGADAGISFAECEVLVDTSRPAFTSPAPPVSGSVAITQAQDTQPATAGAQRSVGFTAVVPAMGHVELCVSSAAFAPTGATDCPGGPAGWKVLSASVTTGQILTLPEGQYSVKLVVVGGAQTVDSLPLALDVDVTAPCVSGLGVTLPQDTAPSDGLLNAVEVGAASPQISFALDPACGPAATAVVRNVAAGAVGAISYSASVSAVTSPLTVGLSTNVASTETLDLIVVVTDVAGNTNIFRGLTQNATARKTVSIDRDIPTCVLSQPSKVGALNTLDLPSAGAGQFTLAAIAQTSSDVPVVIFQLGSGAPVNANVTAQSATTSFSVAGTMSGQTLSATCRDAAQNSVQVQRSLDWDLDVPTCAIASPASGSNSTSNDITTTVNVNGAPSRPVTIRSSLQVADIGSLIVSGTAASGLLTYPNGIQTVTASVSDAAGNPCTASSTNVVVNSSSCSLQLTSGYVNGASVWMNRVNTTPTGATTATANIVAASSSCPAGFTVTLTRTAPTSGLIATQTTSSGSVSFANVALTDGEQYSVSIDNGAGLLTTRTFSVDLVAPLVGGSTLNGQPTPALGLFFVAAQNNRRVETATAGYFADADGATAGAQFSMTVSNIQNAFQGLLGGVAEVLFKGVVLSTTPITTTPATVTLPSLTLPHPDSGNFQVRVRDQAGNEVVVASQTATIDVVSPAAPSVTRMLTSARGATVSLQWAPVYDDGATSTSGNVFDYDVRWTTSSTAGNNSMASATDYFGSSAFRDSASPPSGTTISRSLTLPPLNSYYIAVRARDEVDNYSTYAAPTVVDNLWARVALSGAAGTAFGSMVATGASLNNDASEDLAVAAATVSLAGSVQLFYGGAGFTGQTSCVAPACTSITAPDAIGVNFGADVSMAGNLGDAAGEGKADLVVGQTGFPTAAGEGRVFIYFGSASATAVSTATFIEIRGSTTLTSTIGSVAKIIGDIDGDSLGELVITAPAYNSNLGRLFIFRGRTVAQWQAARTSTDPVSMAPFIPVASADWIIEGPNPALTTASSYFGRLRFGVTSIGDITGDGRAEFTTGMGRSTVNRVQLFSGGTVATTASPMANTVDLQLFLPPEGVGTDTNNARGFGASVLGGFNLTNASANDVAVSWIARPGGGAVYVYADPTALGVPASPSLTLEGPLLYGSQVSAGQLNSDSNPDLVVGVDTTTSATAFVLWSQSGSFDTPVGGATPRFWFSRIDGTVLAGSTSTSLGRWNAVADLNADGNSDLILADQQNSTVNIFR